MNKTWKRLLSVILTVMMIVPLGLTGTAADRSGWVSASYEKVDNGGKSIHSPLGEYESEAEDEYAANDVVRVSIILKGKSTLEKGFSTEGIAQNNAAKNYRAGVKAQQDKLANNISRLALGGEKLDVVWNLTLAANVISANVKYGQIKNIKSIPGVRDVVIETRYLPAEAEDTADPQMSTAIEMTGANYIYTEFNGAGESVAIIDTGIDVEHELFDPDAFEYAILEDEDYLENSVDLITADDVAEVFDQLNVKSFADVTADDLYVNSKIPFAFNYVDGNLDVSHAKDTESEHGSHVAGIAAANRYIKVGSQFKESLEEVYTQGEAPDAQILAMKVFGIGGGAYDSDYFAAVEDSIVLGAASANLSIGSAVAGMSFNSTYQDLLDGLAETDVNVIMSAGNNGSWADQTLFGYLYGEDKNLFTGGSPGSYVNSLSVASVDNYGQTGASFKFFGKSVFYTEKEYSNLPMTTLKGEYEFVAIKGIGSEAQFELLDDVLDGKIAICSRGEISFFQKAEAAVKYGAAATVIYNNTAGTINMDLSDYSYTNPCVSITQADGQFIIENAEEHSIDPVVDGETGALIKDGITYYTGTVTMPDGIEVNRPDDLDYLIMSDFSSFGLPGSLILKPEITAPGGNIYSVNGYHLDDNGKPAGGHNKYENMSGTSMAAPQIAGLSAVFHQYAKEEKLVEKTGLSLRQLTNSLLMSTAIPLYDGASDYGGYYSILKQGAGLVDIVSAINASSYILMNEDATASASDGKVKAEIGVVDRDDPTFEFSFNVTNFSEYETGYELMSEFFTQDYFLYYEYDENGDEVFDEEGAHRFSYYMDTWTAPLEADVVWTVNGEPYVPEELSPYDFNGDGVITYSDCRVILDYTVGKIESFEGIELADFDEDGEIDTYDAKLFIDMVKSCTFNLDAGESAEVKISVELLDADYYDLNGAYVEGFVYVIEESTVDGAIGAVHSIPVIGFYGDWLESSMYDHGSYIDYSFGTEEHIPYMAAALGADSHYVRAFSIDYAGVGRYLSGGNPFFRDDQYFPERSSIKSTDKIAEATFSLIRNAAAGRITVTDDNGNYLYTKNLGETYAAYYSENQGRWYNAKNTQTIGFSPAGIEEGTAITAAVKLVPEYYTMQGEVDWDGLSEGAIFSQTWVIDDTCPEIDSVEVHYNDTLNAYDAVKVVAGDNRFISAASLYDEDDNVIDEYGADQDPEAEAGVYYEYLFDFTELYDDLSEVPAHLMIEIGDYACNVSTYKINLRPEELNDPVTLALEPDSVTLVKGTSQQVTPIVRPWAGNEAVVWASDDDTIATVSDDGVITGVAEGTTTVTCTTVADPAVSADVAVTVKEISKQLDGIVWDEEGEVWFAGFNTKTLPAYDKKTDEPLNVPISSLAYDKDGNLYGASFDTEAWTSNFYLIDETDYSAELIGGSTLVGYADIAPAPSLDNDYFVAAYGPYFVVLDKTTGDYVTFFNFSEDTSERYIVGVTYAGSFMNTYYNLPVDWYYFVDTEGTLYETGLINVEGTLYNFNVTNDGKIGGAVDVEFFQSFYCDVDGNVFWTRFNEGEDDVDVIMLDLFDTGSVFELGSFDKQVWPFGGLYEEGDALVFYYDIMIEGVDSRSDLRVAGSSVDSVEKIVPTASPAKGTLNAAPAKDGGVARPERIELYYTEIDLRADETIYNGLYEVKYDPAVYEISSSWVWADNYSINSEEGKLTFAFADLEPFEKDDYFATLGFEAIGEGDKTITVTTKELNDTKPGTVEWMFTSYTETFGAPEWTWTEENTATAAFTGNGGTVKTLDAVVTSETVDATYTADGKTVYTATVMFQGKVYKDVKVVTIDKLEVPFEDVQINNWFFNSVMWAVKGNITAGTDATHFSPMGAITRAQAVTFLYAAAGKPEVTNTNNPFTDVSEKSYYYKAVLWAVENGITAGTSATKFSPGSQCTREQIVSFLYAFCKKPEVSSQKTPFKDVAEGKWYSAAIAWAYNNGITYGTGAATFGLGNICTRAQIVTILYAALGDVSAN